MKTTIIPAQITTVEDRIAGSLNFTQILLLMIPVVSTTGIYTLISSAMLLSWLKVVLSAVVLAISVLLSLRIRGKIILDHLLTRLHFSLRPRIWVPMKTDTSYKCIDLPEMPEIQDAHIRVKTPAYKPPLGVTLADIVKFERYLTKNQFTIRYKSNSKGGLDVAYEPIR